MFKSNMTKQRNDIDGSDTNTIDCYVCTLKMIQFSKSKWWYQYQCKSYWIVFNWEQWDQSRYGSIL